MHPTVTRAPSDARRRYSQPSCNHGGMSEWLKETGCKPVGSAYAGSNPAPAIKLPVGSRIVSLVDAGRSSPVRWPLYFQPVRRSKFR